MNNYLRNLIYLRKFLELAFLIGLTGLIVHSTYKLIDVLRSRDSLDRSETFLFAFSILSATASIYHLFFTPLLLNLRFGCKTRCVTIGLCTYDAVNYLFCHCWLLKPCRDRCFTKWTTAKWACLTILMTCTILLVKDYKTKM